MARVDNPNDLLEDIRMNAGALKGATNPDPKTVTDLASDIMQLDMHLLEGGAPPDGWALRKLSKSDSS